MLNACTPDAGATLPLTEWGCRLASRPRWLAGAAGAEGGGYRGRVPTAGAGVVGSVPNG